MDSPLISICVSFVITVITALVMFIRRRRAIAASQQ
jgi:hypothetical protein